MATLDVYRDWLGITEPARPLNYYQLFKLKQFEDDAAQIRARYRKFNAEVRKYAAGQFGEQSQILLNDLAKAMLCLTDATRKAEYDASLGRSGGETSRRTFEQILVARQVVDSAGLDKARRLSRTINVEIRDAVLQLKLAEAEKVMQAYAESLGLPYIDLTDFKIDEKLVPQVPALLARQQSCVPLMVDSGQLLMVSPNMLAPEVEDQLRLRCGAKTVRTVLCTPAAMNELIGKHYPKEAARAQMEAASAAPKAAARAAGAAAAAAGGSASRGNSALHAETRKMFQQERIKYSFVAAGLTFGLASLALFLLAEVFKGKMALTLANLGVLRFAILGVVSAIVGAITFAMTKPK